MKITTLKKRGYGQDLYAVGIFNKEEIQQMKSEGYRILKDKKTLPKNKNGIVVQN